MLDLGKGLLDRIEIGRIGWQEPTPRTGGFDRLTDGSRFVAAEVFYDDDIAWLQDGNQLPLDIGAKALAVDRPRRTRKAPSAGRSSRRRATSWCANHRWRNRPHALAFWPQPLMGVMFVLVRVTSMKTSRSGSR